MKIVLLNPSLTDKQQSGDLGGVANVLLPLGLAYIGAILKKNNFEVEVIDCPPLMLENEETIQKIIKIHSDLIGITATCLSFYNAVKCAEKLKEKRPNIPIILGGPHITAIPEEAMEFECFDFGVIGEGEETILELVRKIKNKENDFFNIEGISYRTNNKIILTKRRDYIKDLDTIPFPSRELFPPLTTYRPTPMTLGDWRRCLFSVLIVLSDYVVEFFCVFLCFPGDLYHYAESTEFACYLGLVGVELERSPEIILRHHLITLAEIIVSDLPVK